MPADGEADAAFARMLRRMRRIFESGYFTVGKIWRAPVRIHWTTPLGILLLTGFSFRPLAWIALFGLLLVHELGHAFAARRYHLRVDSIDITAIGGTCRIEGDPTLREAATVAWGGVLAQAGVLVLALLFPFGGSIHDVLVTQNVMLIAVNLLPIEPLDGALAWRLFRG